jgi:hypothetical protein
MTQAYLPIQTGAHQAGAAAGFDLDITLANQLGSRLHEQYTTQAPFPHIVIEDFMPPAILQQVLEKFPDIETKAKVYERGYAGQHKRQISPYHCDPYLKDLFLFFNSAPMLAFIEGVTGIAGLIADPYFVGGGVHETLTGGLLGVHADFRVHDKLQLVRRVNLIVYLNQDWDDAYNGRLELWSTDMKACVKSVAPIFNRCVIFNTDETSFHGHPDPLQCPSDRSRKSLALYYYTAEPIAKQEGVSSETNYVARPNEQAENLRKVKKIQKKRAAKAKGNSTSTFSLAWQRVKQLLGAKH